MFRQVSSGPSAERLKDKYQSKVAEVEEQAKQLKEKQREIKETHTTGLSQIDMMNDLIKLLQIKVWGWVAGCVESQLGGGGRGKGEGGQLGKASQVGIISSISKLLQIKVCLGGEVGGWTAKLACDWPLCC